MGTAISTMIPILAMKFNGVTLTPNVRAREMADKDEENEEDGIPEDIIAAIDGKSILEAPPRTLDGKSHAEAPTCDPDILGDDDEEEEVDNAPDWEFNSDESFSDNPEYIFCPQPHRRQLLCLFTRHFCRHTFFPTRSGIHQTGPEIREDCVEEMYSFCKK